MTHFKSWFSNLTTKILTVLTTNDLKISIVVRLSGLPQNCMLRVGGWNEVSWLLRPCNWKLKRCKERKICPSLQRTIASTQFLWRKHGKYNCSHFQGWKWFWCSFLNERSKSCRPAHYPTPNRSVCPGRILMAQNHLSIAPDTNYHWHLEPDMLPYDFSKFL